MDRKFTVTMPEPVRLLLERIEEWRRTRRKRGAMPEELWREATVLGKEFGMHAVARDLRINYGGLKRRVCGQLAVPMKKKSKPNSDFIDISAIQVEPSSNYSAEMELTRSDGVTLRMRQRGGTPLDAVGLVEALSRGKR